MIKNELDIEINQDLISILYQLSIKHKEFLTSYKFNLDSRLRKMQPKYQILTEFYEDCVLSLTSIFGDEIIDTNIISRITKDERYSYLNKTQSSPTHVIQFENLYSNVLVKLYDNNIIKFRHEKFGIMITSLIKHRKYIKQYFSQKSTCDKFPDYLYDTMIRQNVWFLTKILINMTYSRIKIKYKISNFQHIHNYTKHIFNMLNEMAIVNLINIDIIYINSDSINTVKHILDKLELPYTIEEFTPDIQKEYEHHCNHVIFRKQQIEENDYTVIE